MLLFIFIATGLTRGICDLGVIRAGGPILYVPLGYPTWNLPNLRPICLCPFPLKYGVRRCFAVQPILYYIFWGKRVHKTREALSFERLNASVLALIMQNTTLLTYTLHNKNQRFCALSTHTCRHLNV